MLKLIEQGKLQNALSKEDLSFLQNEMRSIFVLLEEYIFSEKQFEINNISLVAERAEKEIIAASNSLYEASKAQIGKSLLWIVEIVINKLENDYPKGALSNYEERNEVLQKLKTRIRKHLLNDKIEVPYFPVKIKWNAPKNVLYQLFRELRNKPNSKNEMYVGNGFHEIATFIKNNFTGFEEKSVYDIEKELNRERNSLKAIKIPKEGQGQE